MYTSRSLTNILENYVGGKSYVDYVQELMNKHKENYDYNNSGKTDSESQKSKKKNRKIND